MVRKDSLVALEIIELLSLGLEKKKKIKDHEQDFIFQTPKNL